MAWPLVRREGFLTLVVKPEEFYRQAGSAARPAKKRYIKWRQRLQRAADKAAAEHCEFVTVALDYQKPGQGFQPSGVPPKSCKNIPGRR